MIYCEQPFRMETIANEGPQLFSAICPLLCCACLSSNPYGRPNGIVGADGLLKHITS